GRAQIRRRGHQPGQAERGPESRGDEKETVNRVTAWAALALAASGCAFAAETAQARGKRIVDEAIAAMGGDAFMHVQNRVESGRAFSFYREQLEGLSVARIYTRYLEPSGAPKPGTLLEE